MGAWSARTGTAASGSADSCTAANRIRPWSLSSSRSRRGVSGVDFSDVALDAARAAAPGAEWVQADLREYAPAESDYDLVLYAFVQLPAVERRATLDRAASALAPGGMLLVVGHDPLNLTEGWAGPTDPLVLFTPEDVIAELPGLAIERAERVRRPVTDEDGRPQVQVDAVVRAVAPA